MFDVAPMSRRHVAGLRDAAADAWHILSRVAPVLRALPDDALEAMGIPPAALAACRRFEPHLPTSVVARFDFAITDADEPKVLELNAETPMFLWESHEIAGCVAEALGYDDPNVGMRERLRDAIVRAVGPDSTLRVAVAAYNTWREDWFTAAFAARVAADGLGRAVDVIPLHDLRITRDALRDGAGRAIDVLWRIYPLEQLALDRDGPRLLDLVENGRLRLINPPGSLLLQNKAAQAIVWGLAQNQTWFDAAERAIIERRFLPTFLDQPDDADLYVRKPVLGREGSGISVVRGGTILATSPGRKYSQQPVVFQKYVRLPATHGGRYIATCFVIDGVPGAVALRVGGEITDGHARFLPIGLVKPEFVADERMR